MKKKISITISRRIVWRGQSSACASQVIDIPVDPQPAHLTGKPSWWTSLRKLLLPMLVLAAIPALRAQAPPTIRITAIGPSTISPSNPLMADDFAAFTVSVAYTQPTAVSAYIRVKIDEVNDKGVRALPEPNDFFVSKTGETVTIQIPSYRVPNSRCVDRDSCAKASTVKELRFTAQFLNTSKVLQAQSAQRVFDLFLYPAIQSVTPATQPLNTTETGHRITVSGASFTSATNISLDLYPFAARTDDAYRSFFIGGYAGNACRIPRLPQQPDTWLCDIRVINDTTLEFTAAIYSPLPGTSSIGDYGAILTWNKASGGAGSAYSGNPLFSVGPPRLNDDKITITSMTLSVGNPPVQTNLAPGRVDSIPYAPGSRVVIGVDGSYKLTRDYIGGLWLGVRDAATKTVISAVGPGLAANTFGGTRALGPLNDHGEVGKIGAAFLMPDPPRDLEFFVTLTSFDATDPFKGAYATATIAAIGAQTGDLTITYIQPIQVVHNFPPPLYTGPKGSEYKWQEMPFIAGKTTLVRVWIKNVGTNPTAINNVTAVLHGYATSVLSPNTPDPLQPVTRPITAQPYTGPLPLQSPPDFDEATVDFYLPDDWIKADGAITIKVDIVPPSGFTDTNIVNNSVTRAIALEKQPSGPNAVTPGRLRVGWIPVCYHLALGVDYVETCPQDQVSNYKDNIVKWFPVADAGVDFVRIQPEAGPLILNRVITTAAEYQSFLKTELRPLVAVADPPVDFLIGFIVDLTPFVVRGPCPGNQPAPARPPCLPGGVADMIDLGGLGQAALITADTAGSEEINNYTRLSVAHELGHLVGLGHVTVSSTNKGNVNFGGCDDNTAQNDCPNWPYLDPSIQFQGIDSTVFRKLKAGDTYDFMSYCSNNGASNMWASPYTFRKLFNNGLSPSRVLPEVWTPILCGGDSEPLPSVQKESLMTPALRRLTSSPVKRAAGPQQDLFLVSGIVRQDGSSASINPVFRLRTSAPAAVSDPAGNYCLQFSDAQGGALGSFCFSLSFKNSESREVMDQDGFSYFLPLPAATTTVALTNNGSVLATNTAGAQPPTVTILSPQAGQDWSSGKQTLSWTGVSNGTAAAKYMVDYSSDGGSTWSVLSMPTENTQLSVNPATLRAASGSVVFRVTVSDGVVNASAMLGPVTITQKASGSLTPDPVDFRNGLPGVAVKRDVMLTNTGSGPLRVSAASFPNKAFSLVSPTPPFDVIAGIPMPLKLAFTAQAAGAAPGRMILTTNSPDRPLLDVFLTGNGVTSISPDAGVSPERAEFGDAKFKQTVIKKVTLTSYGPASLSLKSVDISGAGFSLTAPVAAVELGPNQTRVIEVRFDPVRAGAHTGSLTIVSDDPAHGTITVPLSGSGAGDGFPGTAQPVISVPATIPFPNATIGSGPTTAVLRISNTGSADLHVSRLTIAPADNTFATVAPFSATAIQVGKPLDVNLKFAPTAAGTFTATLTIASDDPNRPSFPVTLTGTAANPAVQTGLALVAEPTSATFTNPPADITVKLTNPNGFTVQVVSAIPDSSRFSVVKAAGNIGGGSFEYMVIRYTPTAAGASSGTFTVHATDPTRPTFVIPDLKIPVSGPAGPAASPTISAPKTLPLPNFTVGGTPTEATLTITNTGTANLAISSVAISPASTNFQLAAAVPATTLVPKQSLDVKVRFTAAAAGTFTATLNIASNDASQPTFQVSLSGTAVAAPPQTGLAVYSDPSPVTFANPPVDIYVKLNNPNGFTVQYVSGVPDSARFSIIRPADKIGAGSWDYLGIHYNPSGTGAASGTITVQVIDPTRPSFVIPDAKIPVTGPAGSTSTSTQVTLITAAGWPNGRLSNNVPSAAIDGSTSTYTWTTESGNNTNPSYLGVGTSAATPINRLRIYKDPDSGSIGDLGKDLVIEYTTSPTTTALSARTWVRVTGLRNGFNGTELLTADSVSAAGTVTNDRHNSLTAGWASLSFDRVTATGIRIGFSNRPGPIAVNHYRVYEVQVYNDLP